MDLDDPEERQSQSPPFGASFITLLKVTIRSVPVMEGNIDDLVSSRRI